MGALIYRVAAITCSVPKGVGVTNHAWAGHVTEPELYIDSVD